MDTSSLVCRDVLDPRLALYRAVTDHMWHGKVSKLLGMSGSQRADAAVQQ
jgi:hypothetical protein